MSLHIKGRASTEYDAKVDAANERIWRLAKHPELASFKYFCDVLAGHKGSTPAKLLAAHEDPRYHPMVLELDYSDFAYYLCRPSPDGREVPVRSRARIAALMHVFRQVVQRIDYLDTEFVGYIDRLGALENFNIDVRGYPFPDDSIRRRFMVSGDSFSEWSTVFYGLPDTLSYERHDLYTLSGMSDKEKQVLASKALSRALSRFYIGYLLSFAEVIRTTGTSIEHYTSWDMISGSNFHEAVLDGLYAVEFPERLPKEVLQLSL